MVTQAVGFVHDHQIEMVLEEPTVVARRLGRVEGADEEIVLGPVAPPARDHEIEQELGRQLFAPLVGEARRHEDEHPAHESSQHVLLEHEPRLDRLSQPHLVGEQSAATHFPEDAIAGVPLVTEPVDASDVVHGEERLEPAFGGHFLGFEKKPVVVPRFHAALGCAVEQLRR